MSGYLPFLLAVLVCLALPVRAVAVEGAACPGEREVEFLKGLNAEGEFRLAALQGELFLRRAGMDGDSCVAPPGIVLEMGKALYHLGEFARVRRIFRERSLGEDPSHRRYYMESHLLQVERPALADSALAFLNSVEAAAVPAREKALYAAATLHLLGRDVEAKAAWPARESSASSASSYMGAGCGAADGDPLAWLDKGYLSPPLAAGLSAFPGGGYFYAGQPGDGWTALMAVTVLYGVSAFYAWQDAPVRAFAAAGIGGVFHLSGIYGGYRAAVEGNRKRKRAFLRALHPCLP